MFGYVTIYEPELKVQDLKKYRAYYCGLCRLLGREYGLAARMALSYDMTFAALLLSACASGEPARVTAAPTQVPATVTKQVDWIRCSYTARYRWIRLQMPISTAGPSLSKSSIVRNSAG